MPRVRGGPLAYLLLAVTIAGPAASAAPGDGPAAFRIEAHTVHTVDLAGARVLAGYREGQPRVIAGELRLPRGDAVRVPAVLMLHGDGGILANQARWTDDLNARGLAVFTLDSFSPRGFVSADSRVGSIAGAAATSPYARVPDAFAALALLAAHPRIDPARIAVMGFSAGARTALLAALTRFAAVHRTPGTAFRAYVALYPPCNAKLLEDEQLEAGPLRIYIGADDDVAPAAACERYVERLRAAGRDASITVYPRARHGFDNPSGSAPIRNPDALSTARCEVEERERGTILNVATGQPLKAADACVTRGIVAGPDPAAGAAVRRSVADFLVRALEIQSRP